MTAKKWPYQGDSPVARARKVALAYRAVAEQQAQTLALTSDVLKEIDQRLVAFDNPAIGTRLDDLNAAVRNLRNAVEDLDNRFRNWGETWHADVPITYDDNDHIPTSEASKLINIAPGTITRLRVEGRIKGIWDPTIGPRGGWRFKVADIWELSTKLRGRGWRQKDTTDSIPSSGRGDAK